jgi:hypothetical protein
VFYPTEELRDLATSLSVLPAVEQGNFRLGLIELVNRLQSDLGNQLGYTVVLGRNDVVVTHYQVLETAVVLEGFVANDARQTAFKALLDLDNPSSNLVFVPVGEPSDEQLAELQTLNERIIELGGVVDTNATVPAAEVPAPVPAPAPVIVTPAPAPVIITPAPAPAPAVVVVHRRGD